MNDEPKLELTQDEIRQVKNFLEGRRAIQWFAKHSKAVGTWLIVILGALMTVFTIFSDYVKRVVEG